MQSMHAGGYGYSPDEAEVRLSIEREMEPGEALRWCSRANPEILARQARLVALFGIPFLAFSLLWTLGALAAAVATGGLLFFFPLFGLPFCGVGVWLMGAPSRARREGASTFYGITDRRAIIIAGAQSRTVRSWRRHEMRDITRTEHADGSGDIIFSRSTGRSADGHATPVSAGFYGVRDARVVEGLLRSVA